MKRVVWIDDDVEACKTIVKNIFMDLWGNNIRSEIYIFGDYISSIERLEHNREIDYLNRVTFDRFTTHLIRMGYDQNPEEIIKLWPLINSNTVHDESDIIAISDVVTNKNEIFEKNQTLINRWKALNEDYDGDLITDKDYCVKEIVKSLCNDAENAVFMIDLCLVEGDLIKLKKDDKKKDGESNDDIITPLLSMGLYNEINKCFPNRARLYSSFVYPNDSAIRWEQTYKKFYKNDKNIVIYDRYGKPSTKVETTKSNGLIEEILTTLEGVNDFGS